MYVGAVLFCNGLWLLGLIADREVAAIDILVGGIALIVVIIELASSQTGLIFSAAQTLLSVFTYLWVAHTRFAKVDGSGLGWYCLFVCLTAIPTAIVIFNTAHWNGALIWLGIDWVAWAILWGMYFLLLARPVQWAKITRLAGAVTLVEGFGTGWILGYLLLNGSLHT